MVGGFYLFRPSVRTGAPSPEGKALAGRVISAAPYEVGGSTAGGANSRLSGRLERAARASPEGEVAARRADGRVF